MPFAMSMTKAKRILIHSIQTNVSTFSSNGTAGFKKCKQWKRINYKQSARWQHLSRLKASAFLFEFFLLGVKKPNSLYLRLVLPSSG
jgi:hypothetical protein